MARYVSFEKEKTFIIFEQEVETKLGRNTTMGTREYLLEKAKKTGQLEERAKAEAEKLAEKKESAIKMLQNGFELQLISDIIGLPIEEIEKLK